MTQSMSVEYQELMARADELEQPIPPVPPVNPPGPCLLDFVEGTASQLALSANSMRLYLADGETQWKKLAESLRNAAKAYETVDEESAAAMSKVSFDDSGAASGTGNGNQIDSQTGALSNPGKDAGLAAASTAPPPDSADPPPLDFPDYEVREAAERIESGDQGSAYQAFAAEWDAFQLAFQAETYRFRPFISWEGSSQKAVEQNFEQQRQWIYNMTSSAVTMGQQAIRVVEAHEKARVYGNWSGTSASGDYSNFVEHPTTYEVSQCDWWYEEYIRRGMSPEPTEEWYARLQEQSDSSLKNYKVNGNIPLQPIWVSSAPDATTINAPITESPSGGDDPDLSDLPGGGINIPNVPYGSYPGAEDPSVGLGDESLTDGSVSMPAAGMSSLPSSAQGNSNLTDAGKLGNAPGGVRPASAAGGGVGGGGMPKMPLAEAPGAEGAGAGGAAAGRAGVGGALPGVGGRGGAVGGGMPMGGAPGAGQGKDSKQGKRIESAEDEALYTEDRQWTAGVIGRRRAKDNPGEE